MSKQTSEAQPELEVVATIEDGIDVHRRGFRAGRRCTGAG